MRTLLLLLISVAIVSSQTVYPPGLNFMMRTIIFDKIREIIIPDVMQKFEIIRPDDIDHKSGLYEIKIYNMVADIVPLTGDQVSIIFNDAENSMFVEVINFQMHFNANAYGRALFVHAHGDARIRVRIDSFQFKVTPLLKADGDLNELDYHVDSVLVDIHSGDIHLDHLSIGILPSWLLAPIGNMILDHCASAYHSFEGVIGNMIVEILNEHRAKIPDAMAIPNQPFSVSLSFPDIMHLRGDRIEVPFDGTIYLTQQGYHPHAEEAPPMPSFNPDNPNNIQVFLNQHMLKTTFDAVKAANLKYEINADTLAPLDLPQNFLTAEYFNMLFPFMSCHYDDPNAAVTIFVTLDKTLNTAINFAQGKVHGEVSPSLEIYVNNELAIIIAIRAILEANVSFKMIGKASQANAQVTSLDLTDFTFVPGTVSDTDLGDIINIFKPKVIPAVQNAVNGILAKGFLIPVIPVIKTMFEIDIEDIDLEMKDNYLEASFTLDIHQRLALIEKLFKQQSIM